MFKKYIGFYVFLISIFIAEAQPCANAGSDNFVCGSSIDLIGEPSNGFWTYHCEDKNAIVQLDSIIPGTVRLTVTKCGEYTMVYHVHDLPCPSTDTVVLQFEDRTFKIEEISTQITVGYQNIEDYLPSDDSCGNRRVLQSVNKYSPIYTYLFDGTCEKFSLASTPINIDSATCLAKTLRSDIKIQRDTDELHWISTQEAFLIKDGSGDTLNYFTKYYEALLNTFLEQLDSRCPLDKCFVDHTNCKDTFSFDSIEVILPIHLGGQWHYWMDSVWSPLQDTTHIRQGNSNIVCVLENGSYQYSDSTFICTVYEQDSVGAWFDIQQKIQLTFRWFEKWSYDTVIMYYPKEIIDDNCLCNGRTILFNPLVFPAFQPRNFKELPLNFIPLPKPKILGDTIFCEGSFTLLSADKMYTKYNWSNHDNLQTTYVNSSQLIILQVENEFACTGADTVNIKMSQSPLFSIRADNSTICNGTCVELTTTADSSFTVIWNNLDTVPTLRICPSITEGYLAKVINLEGCESSETIQIKVIPAPDPIVGSNKTLTCSVKDVVLTINRADTGKFRIFYWSGPGIDSINKYILSPIVNVHGIYTFHVIDTITKCEGLDSLEVTRNQLPPRSNAGKDMVLSCNSQAVQLRGDSSQFGPGFGFEWMGPGIFSFNKFAINPVVQIYGTYILMVINLNNDCVSYDTVQVLEDFNQPIADAGIDKLIFCDSAFITIGGNGSTMGSDIFYTWAGPAINLGNRNEQFPKINQEGRYTLIVTNGNNFCKDTDYVDVVIPKSLPTSNVLKLQDLGCGIDTVILFGQNSFGQHLRYHWKSDVVDTISTTLKNLIVIRPGQYILIVRDTSTHCEDADTVIVLDKGPNPYVAAGPDKVINCEQGEVELEGTIIHLNPIVFIQWIGPDISANQAHIKRPVVDSAGQYILFVVDSISGCFSSDTVTISKEIILPKVDLGPDLVLNCKIASVDVLATLSNIQSNYYYEWLGPGISEIAKRNLTQELNIPGVYVFIISTGNPACFASDTFILDLDTLVIPILIRDSLFMTCDVISFTETIDSFPGLDSIVWVDENNAKLETKKSGREVTFNKPGTYTFTSFQNNGCQYSRSIVVIPYASISLQLTSNISCHTKKDAFIKVENIIAIQPYFIQLGTGPLDTTTLFNQLQPGGYSITLHDGRGCSKTFQINVQAYPILDRLPQPDHILFCGDTLFTPPQANIPVFQKWLDNSTSKPIRKFTKAGQYLMSYVDVNRCDSFILEFNLERIKNDTLITEESVPNVFTPNGDSRNENFGVLVPDNSVFEAFDMKIYNRFGQLIFHSQDPLLKWDGSYKGTLAPVDTYLVILNGAMNICSRRSLFSIKTDVSLIR